MVIALEMALNKVMLCSNVPEKLIWIHERAGMFFSKNLTDLIINMGVDDQEFDFDKLCKLKAPPKVKNFLWMLKLERLPTKEFLKKRGILSKEDLCTCSWSNLGVENVNHNFVGCSFAKNFLGLFCEWWKVSWVVNCNVKELIDFCFEVSFAWTTRSLWLIFVVAAFWSMWLSRKDKVW
ncbi:hypothetical protein V6N13_016789 [Hibiscus sabdariffa]